VEDRRASDTSGSVAPVDPVRSQAEVSSLQAYKGSFQVPVNSGATRIFRNRLSRCGDTTKNVTAALDDDAWIDLTSKRIAGDRARLPTKSFVAKEWPGMALEEKLSTIGRITTGARGIKSSRPRGRLMSSSALPELCGSGRFLRQFA
jgi:hypothetical protein